MSEYFVITFFSPFKMRMSQRGLQILSKPPDQRTADDIRYVSLLYNSHMIEWLLSTVREYFILVIYQTYYI